MSKNYTIVFNKSQLKYVFGIVLLAVLLMSLIVNLFIFSAFSTIVWKQYDVTLIHYEFPNNCDYDHPTIEAPYYVYSGIAVPVKVCNLLNNTQYFVSLSKNHYGYTINNTIFNSSNINNDILYYDLDILDLYENDFVYINLFQANLTQPIDLQLSIYIDLSSIQKEN